MSAPPYMKLFWGDYHKATRHLRRDQHGAYFLLIGEAWRLGGSLPDDDDLLAAWALCTPDEWSAMKPVITAFFALRRGKWVHDRVREELVSYETTSRKRKAAGRKGGSVTHGNHDGNPEAIAKLKPTKPEPEPEPESEIREPIGSLITHAPDRTPDGFDDFWRAYPSKVGKREAVKAYARAAKRIEGPDPPIVVILAGVERAKASRRWREGFIPNPATWLNQDRWTDELPEAGHERPNDRQTFAADQRRADTEARRNGWAAAIAERAGLPSGPEERGSSGADDDGRGDLRLVDAREA